ncbi:hypothetical protein [Candidatus Nitrotoga sp. AM1P]|uniref:hypothetical protein n=1 Tax=Candidatus Nitrotoga sp. AM1P TaxID=2559597 RepID=UPI0010B55517|nr:hypothetical protein [Candidatus Nitrotoga sp. AM1P]BBJ23090.1 hypothetical protein W01_10170 [Candidatus Nitrotoga sp. AM1P]
MKILKSSISLLFILGLVIAGISACTQMPTEKQNVTDMRPQLSFKILDERLLVAKVYVDGLDMGSIGEFREGIASLRIRSGSHLIRININDQVLVEEKLYFGDGVNRTILVK